MIDGSIICWKDPNLASVMHDLAKSIPRQDGDSQTASRDRLDNADFIHDHA